MKILAEWEQTEMQAMRPKDMSLEGSVMVSNLEDTHSFINVFINTSSKYLTSFLTNFEESVVFNLLTAS